MATYLDMRSRIADELANDGDITDAQINNAIQSAIAYYSGEVFWFNQRIVVFSTLAGGEIYSSSPTSTFENIITIQSIVNTTNSAYMLQPIDNTNIDEIQTGSVTGWPQYYSRVENKIRLYPVPDATYTLQMTYTYILPALSADDDSNAWTNECEELIRQAAKKRIALDILQSDAIAGRCAALEKEAYEGVRMENRLRRSQQSLRTQIPLSRSTFNIYSGW